jgi:hypothetical protein
LASKKDKAEAVFEAMSCDGIHCQFCRQVIHEGAAAVINLNTGRKLAHFSCWTINGYKSKR